LFLSYRADKQTNKQTNRITHTLTDTHEHFTRVTTIGVNNNKKDKKLCKGMVN